MPTNIFSGESMSNIALSPIFDSTLEKIRVLNLVVNMDRFLSTENIHKRNKWQKKTYRTAHSCVFILSLTRCFATV